MSDPVIDKTMATRIATQLGWEPKREWQGLTYKERNDCLVEADPCEALLDHEAHELMRTVEAKLKEKNT
jgi:hypothetical protein